MIRDTTVTIVILSPNMKLSNWMNWEISYSLSEITRDNRVSLTNGIVCVVQKHPFFVFDDGYFWMKDWNGNWDLSKCFEVIRLNQNNKKKYATSLLSPNYIDIVSEEDFLRDPNRYIEDAYEKAKSGEYYISKRGENW